MGKERFRLAEIIHRFADATVIVLGDFILDEYVFGEISRISREAPVLILKYQETLRAAGGGANAAAGVAALGARTFALGFIGKDEFGEALTSCWPPSIDSSGVFREPGLATTRKTRILAGSFHSFRQQVVRLDHEMAAQLNSVQERRILEVLEERIPLANALILSDYGLGNVTGTVRVQAIQQARRRSIPVVVDSRFDPAGFPGATSVTPNITEVEEAIRSRIGQSQSVLEAKGKELLEAWRLEALLITRGKLGMSLFEPGRILHIPRYGSEAVDVTGAGDTVIAAYTTSLAAGATFEEAARIANYAGGMVVGKKGTAVVTREELLRAVADVAGK